MLTNQKLNFHCGSLYTGICCHVSSTLHWSTLSHIWSTPWLIVDHLDRSSITLIDRRSPFRSRSLPIVDHPSHHNHYRSSITIHNRDHSDPRSSSLIVDHLSDPDHCRSPTPILDRYHAWSRVVISILTTLCVLDLGIVILDLGIVIIDLTFAQLNSPSLPPHDLSYFRITQTRDHSIFLWSTPPQKCGAWREAIFGGLNSSIQCCSHAMSCAIKS